MKKVFDTTVLSFYITILFGFTITLLCSFIWLINKMDILNISENIAQYILATVVLIIGIIIGMVVAGFIFNNGIEHEKQKNVKIFNK